MNKVQQADNFRNYDNPGRETVRKFYELNHTHQTVDFVRNKQAEYQGLTKAKMTVWEAIEKLDQIVDDSDPDTELSQLDHALQTAERIRQDNHPRWMILTGLIHDLGKVLTLFGEPQWAVVGDTFPVGCAYSDKIVYPEFFQLNPDTKNETYQTQLGIYQKNCGLENVLMSFGHDEYLYYVTKQFLPIEAQYIIRYHSFYPWHKCGAYDYLCNEKDRELLTWVKKFNPYDLYSKADDKPDFEKLKAFYHDLIDEFLPDTLNW